MTTQTDISTELTERAATLAAESNRSADEIIEQALRSGLESFERQLRSLQRGVDQAARGEFVTDKKLNALRNKYRPDET